MGNRGVGLGVHIRRKNIRTVFFLLQGGKIKRLTSNNKYRFLVIPAKIYHLLILEKREIIKNKAPPPSILSNLLFSFSSPYSPSFYSKAPSSVQVFIYTFRK